MALKGTQACRGAGAGNVPYNVFPSRKYSLCLKKKHLKITQGVFKLEITHTTHNNRETNFMLIQYSYLEGVGCVCVGGEISRSLGHGLLC